jgi:hypothetical protein
MSPSSQPTPEQVADTRRRARLRGKEAEAQWPIRAGVWAGRLYTVVFFVFALLPLLRRGGPDWIAVILLALVGGGILFATERMRLGSRVAACALFGLFVLTKLLDIMGGAQWYAGLLWTVIIGAALGNAVWGTFMLAGVRREAALVPPAPAHSSSADLPPRS